MNKRIKELDEVLKIIVSIDMTKENALPVIPKRYIHIELKKKGFDITESHLTAILSKLLIDKYISIDRGIIKGMKQSFYIYGEVSYEDKTGMTVRSLSPDIEKIDDVKEDLYWATWEGIYFAEDDGYKKFYANTRRENFPKRNWLLIAICAYVFGILSPLIVEYSKKRIWQESIQSGKTILIVSDSLTVKKRDK